MSDLIQVLDQAVGPLLDQARKLEYQLARSSAVSMEATKLYAITSGLYQSIDRIRRLQSDLESEAVAVGIDWSGHDPRYPNVTPNLI